MNGLRGIDWHSVADGLAFRAKNELPLVEFDERVVAALGGQHHVLHAMAHALGYTCTRATPDQSGGDPVEAQMRFAVAVADLLRAHADAVLEGDGAVTRNMVRRAEHHAQEAIASINHLVATLRGRMRAAPESAP